MRCFIMGLTDYPASVYEIRKCVVPLRAPTTMPDAVPVCSVEKERMWPGVYVTGYRSRQEKSAWTVRGHRAGQKGRTLRDHRAC